MTIDRKALLDDQTALESESAELTKALTGLTCGGSEFFIRKGDRYTADIDACVEWVRRRDRTAAERAMSAIQDRNKVQAEVTRLEGENERLRERLQAIIDWADYALANPAEFDSHGVRNLSGPVFDAARAALTPTEGENL